MLLHIICRRERQKGIEEERILKFNFQNKTVKLLTLSVSVLSCGWNLQKCLHSLTNYGHKVWANPASLLSELARGEKSSFMLITRDQNAQKMSKYPLCLPHHDLLCCSW